MASNKLSNLTRRVIPEFVRDDYEAFETFIKSYFEYLEQDLGEYDTAANLLNYRDINETVNLFIEQFKFEKAPNLPPTAAASLRLLIKKIKLFYKVKGTEAGYKFLYRAIFDSSIEFYYPRVDILRTSDNTTVLNDDKILDSYYWQDFSYEIQSDVQKSAFYDKLLRDLVHPAGLKYFNRLSFNPDVSPMPGITFIESIMALIIQSTGNIDISLSESILDILLVKYTTQSLFHSTGYFEANREDDAKMSRLGFFNMGSFDDVPIWMIEGRTGTSLGILFTNGLKNSAEDYTVIDDVLSLNERVSGERIDLLHIPKYVRNMAGHFIADGQSSSINVDFVGTNKSELFVFVNGFKQLQSDYSLNASGVLTFSNLPIKNSTLDYYIVKHISENFNYAEDVNSYSLNKSVKGNENYINVFIKGKLQEVDVDYSIDSVNNKLIILNVLTIGSPIEVTHIDKSSRDCFLTNGTAINSPRTLFRIYERLDSFNPRPSAELAIAPAP